MKEKNVEKLLMHMADNLIGSIEYAEENDLPTDTSSMFLAGYLEIMSVGDFFEYQNTESLVKDYIIEQLSNSGIYICAEDIVETTVH